MATTSGSSDSLMVIGAVEPKLTKFLNRIGYTVHIPNGETPLPDQLSKTFCDLILIDSRIDIDVLSLCDYLREDPAMKGVPIVFIGAPDEVRKLQERNYRRVELVDTSVSAGVILSKIATQLRLRKMAGSEEGASLAELAAAQRDQSARIKRELEEARTIQESLLPLQIPSDPRYDLAVLYHPLEEVGGDWYYMQRERSGALSLHIADVTGHGLSAAFIGSMTKLAFCAAEEEHPGKRLQAINKLLSPQLPDGRFVTLLGGLYHPDTGRFELARAGHPPGLWLSRKSGIVRHISPDGFAVGFFPDSTYVVEELSLEPGDVMLLFTDGIVEAQDRNSECYGMLRLSQALQSSNVSDDADGILRHLKSDFDSFVDGRIPRDDITLMILRRQ